jgi:hypothetical protein
VAVMDICSHISHYHSLYSIIYTAFQACDILLYIGLQLLHKYKEKECCIRAAVYKRIAGLTRIETV